jgi:hypothetical protein
MLNYRKEKIMKRHNRDNFFVVGEGILSFDEKNQPVTNPASTLAELRKFRFSRLGPKGMQLDDSLRIALAEAMTKETNQPDSVGNSIPSGFTYLGQFVDHDMTLDNTARSLGENVSVADLVQGRSPALDLDSLYGRGPHHPEDAKFYSDGIRLKMGKTKQTAFPDNRTNVDMAGFDLPRTAFGSTKAARRKALIPDQRNDENLVVAQTHLAFIRFHNTVVKKLARGGTPSALLFETARRTVVRHYQWMLKTDFLPRIVDPIIVDEVFAHGRQFFEPHPLPGSTPTMPIEFSVAAYRLGHSMIRGAYQWNRVFKAGGPGPIGSLLLLFTFSGTSGILSPDGNLNDPESGSFERLPTNWIADFRRLYDFSEAGRDDLVMNPTDFNVAKQIDTLLVDPLKQLPLGSFGGRGTNPPPAELNLAFRNLTRAKMVSLATGQQMADMMGVTKLTRAQIIEGNGGADLSSLSKAQQDAIVANTPLWYYILREAEFNRGVLTGVGGRIVAEVFHRAIEGSRISILENPFWRPSLGPNPDAFRMVDLLLFAFEGKAELLNPLGN